MVRLARGVERPGDADHAGPALVDAIGALVTTVAGSTGP
jgi:hypothetical protein